MISAGDVVLGIAVPLSTCPLLCLTAERKSQGEELRAAWGCGLLGKKVGRESGSPAQWHEGILCWCNESVGLGCSCILGWALSMTAC